jgi:hypothetical protein
MGHNRVVTLESDAVLLDAVDAARQAVQEETSDVGAHIAASMEDDRIAVHEFECTSPAYLGWRWVVVVTRAPRSKAVTVNEVVLLPGPDALVAPPWVPWSDRVRPGDLGVGDVLPTAPDDQRLVPGYTGWDEGFADEPLTPTPWELGLGRERVLSITGRDEAADRWFAGDFGPESVMAISTAEVCGTCGFMVSIGGAFGQAFGVCGNAMAPADGHVVSLLYGCGAHSQIHVEDVVVEPMADEALGHS